MLCYYAWKAWKSPPLLTDKWPNRAFLGMDNEKLVNDPLTTVPAE